MARKIQPRSKVPKPKKGQSSEEYWRERESRQRAINIRDEARTAERINEIFESMQDSIQQEIESFYQRYADDEGITLTEARGRVSRIDMEQYERLAKKYVEAAHHGDRDTAFSQEANDQMRLYNLTMKVNRLEMLKARCGIRAMEGYRDTERLINENLEERAYSEYRRLAGILGNSVQFNENMVRAIVNASYQNATWSQRLWNHQASLSSQIGTQLASGILAGKSSNVLAREIQKLTGGSTYACQRLMRTELRRVQTEAALQSMTDNGVTEYKFMVENGVNPCDECLALDGQVFKLSDMNVGKNAPPIHPSCHCASAPHVDEDKWQRWLDGPAQAGVPWGEFEDGFSSNLDDEKNRAIRFGNSNSFEQYGRTVYTREVNNSGNNLHIDETISLSRKQIRDIDGMISRAKEIHGASYTCNAPFVITDNRGRIASYNPRTNTFFIDYRMANLDKVIEQQQGFAAPDNIYSTVVHEIFHWKDAEDYRQNGFIIDRADFKSTYSQYNRNIAKRELKKAGIDLSNPSGIAGISEYAYLKWLENDFEEVYTEYRTNELLKE
jgi:SPP1 gp7 family putative phage head morphogenesis protein